MIRIHNLHLFRHLTVILLMTVLAGYSQNAFSQAEKRLLREGNRLYQKELFDESELSYRRALEKAEDSPLARFNLGNSLYKQDRYDEATRFFGELADDIEDPLNRSKVYHNLGNSLLMSQQIPQSIAAYKEALRNNPGDEETRYNLAFAQHLLDEMENQPEGDGDGEDGDQDQEDEDRGEGDDQGEHDDRAGDGQDNMDDADDREAPDTGSDSGEDDMPRQSDQPQPGEISPEDALRMLEAAEREEQRVQEKLMESKSAGQQPGTGRNW